ncbi:MAG: efflux RND transporter permease subunit [Rhodothermaceae bacterium]|nr:efflux RND transporter permease subunit [Rhodothermaceae bacterium]MXZ58538.1 efflux RND transporter permease subunit [Rhodothermaceae bacterium]MYB90057.1 efflux RND transporter permease subunit [Rhodothermaceae bacterium]MYD67715.1 efflux RND transporter permease subunit [Rhodothermaceae bacterium]MYG43798.1 efflux RND transporter permease subunit [Rhodothermaceae bacterium]
MKSFIFSCLNRPVAVTAFYALLLVLAVVAYVRLPVALLPDLRYPGLVVWTSYPDVPPDRVERAVTERIEQAVAGTAGLTRVTSRTLLGGSLVHMQFGWNSNLDLALLDVRENLDRLGDTFPREASRPAVLHLDPGDRPIMVIALRNRADQQGSDRPEDLVELKRVGRDLIARRLEQLSDVARVQVTGGFERRIEVEIDPDQKLAYGISLSQIAGELEGSNVALQGGVIRRGPFRYPVEISGEFKDTEDIAQTVISTRNNTPIRLRDVAQVRDGVAERRGLVRLDGAETLLLLVERKADANIVRAVEEIRTVLAELEEEYEQISLDVVVDESEFIQAAIGGVTQAVLLGGLLAILVLFAFLKRLRALLAAAVAVPLSIAVTLVFFEPLDVTFNLISLSGLALGAGMLVDNAIVVIENIARLREQGQSPLQAARNGASEVAGAITASTLTTIAVFLPITLVEGLAGRLFRDQSLAVVCSLLASLLVALTVVPLIVSRERQTADRPVYKSHAGSRLLTRYGQALSWSLDHRWTVMMFCTLLLMGAGLLISNLPREVIPETEQGRVDVRITLPTDADLTMIALRASEIESQAKARGWADRVLADLGERDQARLDLDPRPPYEGDITLLLPPGQNAEEVLLAVQSMDLPDDVSIKAQRVETQLEQLLTVSDADLLIDLVSEDRRDAEQVVGRVQQLLEARPELVNVRRTDAASVPTYQLTFKRDMMNRYGVHARTLTSYLEAGARGSEATTLKTVNEEVPIVLRSRHIDSIERLLAEQIPARDGLMPIGTFVTAESIPLPAALVRVEQSSVVRLTADIGQGYDLGRAMGAVTDVTSRTLPITVRSRVGGSVEVFQQSLFGVALSLALSLLLVYLILAAQFENLIQPLIILISVPLAAAGVAFVLGLTGQSINLMSLMGTVVLVGIVVNDAIIKTDFINQRRAAGIPIREAIMAAGHDRVRPILMTTITTVLGLLPLAMGFGQGAELRAPLAIAIVGGLTSASVLTLFIVPVLYSILARMK